ncbi:hypothetical protein B0J11DRAFT_567046 [Dendryphion nanum]|uniref:Uncharacterized protein n=1 Tax=Dendryphion nanum TaxID=256645 RepID=A0A9P9DXU4_9PLEO|nr:hypothetical protein B0J11DRAFT_567046 [Dendryphion nanum]
MGGMEAIHRVTCAFLLEQRPGKSLFKGGCEGRRRGGEGGHGKTRPQIAAWPRVEVCVVHLVAAGPWPSGLSSYDIAPGVTPVGIKLYPGPWTVRLEQSKHVWYYRGPAQKRDAPTTHRGVGRGMSLHAQGKRGGGPSTAVQDTQEQEWRPQAKRPHGPHSEQRDGGDKEGHGSGGRRPSLAVLAAFRERAASAEHAHSFAFVRGQGAQHTRGVKRRVWWPDGRTNELQQAKQLTQRKPWTASVDDRRGPCDGEWWRRWMVIPIESAAVSKLPWWSQSKLIQQ